MVKRYDISCFGGMSMDECSDGAYVNYDDYMALEAKCAALAAENAGLKAGGKRIAELEKQCAEWERKALSNFEECAAMAERIEELEQANTRQDSNINHQQEGVTQSVTRYIYHYNAVNGSDSMSGIARLSFMIKSQSDLEELKSALRNIGGFRAKAITSLSYLGREEERAKR